MFLLFLKVALNYLLYLVQRISPKHFWFAFFHVVIVNITACTLIGNACAKIH